MPIAALPKIPSLARSVALGAAVIILWMGGTSSRAAVTLSGDPAYPPDAVVFTVDPEGKDTNQRGITATRNLRQTFQNPMTFNVGQIVVGINVDDAAAATAGLQVRIFEVNDVLGNWAPGNLVKELTFSTVPADVGMASTVRLGITLTGSDVFTLPQRNAGALGYGIEYSNNDGASVFGLLRHTSTAATSEDYYLAGRYLVEGGGGNANRDTGLALAPAPGIEPIPGDVDGDRDIDLADFDPIRDNFRKLVPTRAQGDLTRDGVVSFPDFREWKTAFLAGGGTLAGIDLRLPDNVPEPAGAILVLIALLFGRVQRCRAD